MLKYNFILDVDGVLSSGQFLYSLDGKAYKIFGPHDADGLRLIKDHVNICFISADKRGFPISEKRVNDLGFQVHLVSEQDRFAFVEKKFGFEHLIYMGDGIFDVPLLKASAFGIAPANARLEAKKAADFITASRAAEGAVCDACIEVHKRFLIKKKK